MFREMRRKGQQQTDAEARRILHEGDRAVVSVIGDGGYPYGFPVDWYYEESEETLYFHGAKVGHKVDAIKACDKVCFTTWQDCPIEEGEWACWVKSVIVFGRAEMVTDLEIIKDKVRKIAEKYFPSQEEVEKGMNSGIEHVGLIAVHIEHMTCKLVHEK